MLKVSLKSSVFLIVILAVFNLGLRLFRLDQPPETYFDELAAYVPAARDYLQGNFSTNFEHPLLGKLLIGAGIALLGDNPWGWRVASAVFGTAGVILTYLLARRMFAARPGRTWTSLLAALFLSLDFMWFVHSRIALLEIFLAVFILAALYFLWRYLENYFLKEAVLVGIFLGLALAVKWSAVLVFLAIGVLFLLFHPKPFRQRLFHFLVIVSLTLAVYLASYAPYLAQHSLADLVSLHQKMIGYHQGINELAFEDKPLTWSENLVIHPWLWFLDPPMGYYHQDLGGGRMQQIIMLSHPLIFWLGLFVMFWSGVKALRRRNKEFSFLLITFLSLYLPWFFVSRYQFIYYLLSAIPLLCLGVAYFLYPHWQNRVKRWDVIFYLAAVAAAFIYLYPVLTALTVPDTYWRPWLWFGINPDQIPFYSD
jgi:dolichyl-phosphate-mannose--protein O-mannosyl transferase